MPSDSLTATGSTYHPVVGLIMIFNLIVGTGALALPYAFKQAGWLASAVLLCLIAFFAFITTTFVVEAMAIGNAVIYLRKRHEEAARENGESGVQSSFHDDDDSDEHDENTTSSHALMRPSNELRPYHETNSEAWSPFDIRYRVELGRLSTIFFGRFGQALFYLSMAIYLYGDLAIYATAVPRSLLEVTCMNGSSLENSTIKCKLEFVIISNDN